MKKKKEIEKAKKETENMTLRERNKITNPLIKLRKKYDDDIDMLTKNKMGIYDIKKIKSIIEAIFECEMEIEEMKFPFWKSICQKLKFSKYKLNIMYDLINEKENLL